MNVRLRPARAADLAALVALEDRCFATDRLTRRSFRRWLAAEHRVFLVAESPEGVLLGYCLVVLFRGTRLARLYSLAVDPAARGRGIAEALLREAERRAREAGRIYLRLEVDVENAAAIHLYEKLGYRPFGLFRDYYEDHHDALRMQKCIREIPPNARSRPLPWRAQTTPFTCGPAALLMALGALAPERRCEPWEELRIWREATTIFMTSGHGGCHPVGLALAAARRGLAAEVWVNQAGPLFLESVRVAAKRRVIELVHREFAAEAEQLRLPVAVREFSAAELVERFDGGAVPLILISTYRMDGRKAPHWVAMSGHDADCIYVHDPDPDPEEQSASGIDSQYVPIARDEFARMARFGRRQLRAAVILSRPRLLPGAPA
ncbi:MAG: GNAT family N-acetyltransferase [Porticoccaceae bacterium]|nr:MAG: GNAT family N-acetyltransferase [Porticoccaceae bacterium]